MGIFLECLKHMIGKLKGYVTRRFGYNTEDKGIVVIEVVAPTARLVAAAAIIAGYCPFVVVKVSAPLVDFQLPLAAILHGQNASVGDTD